MPPLFIIAYLDGRPGHEKQTRAILQALADQTEINIVYKKVSISVSAYCKNLLAYLLSFVNTAKNLNLSSSADLIIGTGTYTHLPMLVEKKSRLTAYKKPVYAVTCMSPELFLHNCFDLCCIPAHDDPPVRKNILATLGPPTPRVPNRAHNPDRGLILVGGIDEKSHKWDSEAVSEQIRTLISKSPAIYWIVSSSPRTPEETCAALNRMASELQFSFFRAEDTPAGWVEEQYGMNKTVWVTADSISMVYEALNAGCFVGVLPVDWIRQHNKFQKSIDGLKDRGMIVDFRDWCKGAAMPDKPPEQFNEALRCAREILKRWWPERLANTSERTST